MLAFFGSFHIGELLCIPDHRFSKDTLVYSDINLNAKESITVHVSHPNSNKFGGEIVNVFSFRGHNCCPVKALLSIKELPPAKTLPSLRFAFWTIVHVEITAKKAPARIPDRGHSFRAGIPSALSSRPGLASVEEIQVLGAVTLKQLLGLHQARPPGKKIIFDKFIKIVMNTL